MGKYTNGELDFILEFIGTECKLCDSKKDIIDRIGRLKDRNTGEELSKKYSGKFIKVVSDKKIFIGKLNQVSVSYPYVYLYSGCFLHIDIDTDKIIFENKKDIDSFYINIEDLTIEEITRDEFEEELIMNINYEY